MALARRDVLQAAAAALAGLGLPRQAPAAPAEQWARSVCRACGTAPGLHVGDRDGEVLAVRSEQQDPDRGLRCLGAFPRPETTDAPGRLPPRAVGQHGTLVEAGREEFPALVAGVVIETVAGAAPRVAARLLSEPGLELHGGDGDRRLAAVFSGPDGAALVALGERLLGRDEEILGLYPACVGAEGT